MQPLGNLVEMIGGPKTTGNSDLLVGAQSWGAVPNPSRADDEVVVVVVQGDDTEVRCTMLGEPVISNVLVVVVVVIDWGVLFGFSPR